MNEEKLKRRWTDYLKSLSCGRHTIELSTPNGIDSVKSVGYRLNSQGYEKVYQFHADYRAKSVIVEVKNRAL